MPKKLFFKIIQLFEVVSRENYRFKEAKIREITRLWNCVFNLRIKKNLFI